MIFAERSDHGPGSGVTIGSGIFVGTGVGEGVGEGVLVGGGVFLGVLSGVGVGTGVTVGVGDGVGAGVGSAVGSGVFVASGDTSDPFKGDPVSETAATASPEDFDLSRTDLEAPTKARHVKVTASIVPSAHIIIPALTIPGRFLSVLGLPNSQISQKPQSASRTDQSDSTVSLKLLSTSSMFSRNCSYSERDCFITTTA